MSDRIAVFSDGVIQQLAKPADLYERPDNAFVAQFIGENNRLHGQVTAMNGTTCQVQIPGSGPVRAMAGQCRFRRPGDHAVAAAGAGEDQPAGRQHAQSLQRRGARADLSRRSRAHPRLGLRP